VSAVAQYVEEYRAIRAGLPGGHLPWLTEIRERALAQFSAGGFPSPREEEWKYTNVAPIERTLFRPVTSRGRDASAACPNEEYVIEGASRLVLVDGRFSAALSQLDDLPPGVIICGLAEALAKYPNLVQSHLNLAAGRESHGFIHFNMAFCSDGAFVRIPSGLVLGKPLQIVYLTSQPESLVTVRNLIIAEPHATLTLVETHVSTGELSYLTAGVTEVVVGENAALDLYKLQSESAKAFHFGGTYVQQARSARFRHYNFSFGGLLVRSEIHTELGHAAECLMAGLFLAFGRQHVDNHTLIRHAQPFGISREIYKGILDQRARGVFQGRIVVQQDAQKTDAEMNNRNLLLSEHAEIDTKPQLEIYADDVKCSHGVTVGQLDEHALFFLQTRGINEQDARTMLTFAFANEMVENIQLDSLRSIVQAQLLGLFSEVNLHREWL
jgi:Fe-S cluster assembly protein SufD